MTRLIMAVATGLGTGYLPVAPGTWGSLLGIPLHLALVRLPFPAYCAALAIVLVVAVAAAGSAEKIIDAKDPGLIVIDEIAGMLVSLFGLGTDWLSLAVAFFLFRVFDVLKPFPAGWADQRLNGGVGIVMDDVIAGIYACLATQVLLLFLRGISS